MKNTDVRYRIISLILVLMMVVTSLSNTNIVFGRGGTGVNTSGAGSYSGGVGSNINSYGMGFILVPTLNTSKIKRFLSERDTKKVIKLWRKTFKVKPNDVYKYNKTKKVNIVNADKLLKKDTKVWNLIYKYGVFVSKWKAAKAGNIIIYGDTEKKKRKASKNSLTFNQFTDKVLKAADMNKTSKNRKKLTDKTSTGVLSVNDSGNVVSKKGYHLLFNEGVRKSWAGMSPYFDYIFGTDGVKKKDKGWVCKINDTIKYGTYWYNLVKDLFPASNVNLSSIISNESITNLASLIDVVVIPTSIIGQSGGLAKKKAAAISWSNCIDAVQKSNGYLSKGELSSSDTLFQKGSTYFYGRSPLSYIKIENGKVKIQSSHSVGSSQSVVNGGCFYTDTIDRPVKINDNLKFINNKTNGSKAFILKSGYMIYNNADYGKIHPHDVDGLIRAIGIVNVKDKTTPFDKENQGFENEEYGYNEGKRITKDGDRYLTDNRLLVQFMDNNTEESNINNEPDTKNILESGNKIDLVDIAATSLNRTSIYDNYKDAKLYSVARVINNKDIKIDGEEKGKTTKKFKHKMQLEEATPKIISPYVTKWTTKSGIKAQDNDSMSLTTSVRTPVLSGIKNDNVSIDTLGNDKSVKNIKVTQLGNTSAESYIVKEDSKLNSLVNIVESAATTYRRNVTNTAYKTTRGVYSSKDIDGGIGQVITYVPITDSKVNNLTNNLSSFNVYNDVFVDKLSADKGYHNINRNSCVYNYADSVNNVIYDNIYKTGNYMFSNGMTKELGYNTNATRNNSEVLAGNLLSLLLTTRDNYNLLDGVDYGRTLPLTDYLCMSSWTKCTTMSKPGDVTGYNYKLLFGDDLPRKYNEETYDNKLVESEDDEVVTKDTESYSDEERGDEGTDGDDADSGIIENMEERGNFAYVKEKADKTIESSGNQSSATHIYRFVPEKADENHGWACTYTWTEGSGDSAVTKSETVNYTTNIKYQYYKVYKLDIKKASYSSTDGEHFDGWDFVGNYYYTDNEFSFSTTPNEKDATNCGFSNKYFRGKAHGSRHGQSCSIDITGDIPLTKDDTLIGNIKSNYILTVNAGSDNEDDSLEIIDSGRDSDNTESGASFTDTDDGSTDLDVTEIFEDTDDDETITDIPGASAVVKGSSINNSTFGIGLLNYYDEYYVESNILNAITLELDDTGKASVITDNNFNNSIGFDNGKKTKVYPVSDVCTVSSNLNHYNFNRSKINSDYDIYLMYVPQGNKYGSRGAGPDLRKTVLDNINTNINSIKSVKNFETLLKKTTDTIIRLPFNSSKIFGAFKKSSESRLEGYTILPVAIRHSKSSADYDERDYILKQFQLNHVFYSLNDGKARNVTDNESLLLDEGLLRTSKITNNKYLQMLNSEIEAGYNITKLSLTGVVKDVSGNSSLLESDKNLTYDNYKYLLKTDYVAYEDKAHAIISDTYSTYSTSGVNAVLDKMNIIDYGLNLVRCKYATTKTMEAVSALSYKNNDVKDSINYIQYEKNVVGADLRDMLSSTSKPLVQAKSVVQNRKEETKDMISLFDHLFKFTFTSTNSDELKGADYYGNVTNHLNELGNANLWINSHDTTYLNEYNRNNFGGLVFDYVFKVSNGTRMKEGYLQSHAWAEQYIPKTSSLALREDKDDTDVMGDVERINDKDEKLTSAIMNPNSYNTKKTHLDIIGRATYFKGDDDEGTASDDGIRKKYVMAVTVQNNNVMMKYLPEVRMTTDLLSSTNHNATYNKNDRNTQIIKVLAHTYRRSMSSSMYVVNVKNNMKLEDSQIYSTGMASGARADALSKNRTDKWKNAPVIYAGSDFTVSSKGGEIQIDLTGYSVDLIDKDADSDLTYYKNSMSSDSYWRGTVNSEKLSYTLTTMSYSDWIKSDSDLPKEWGKDICQTIKLPNGVKDNGDTGDGQNVKDEVINNNVERLKKDFDGWVEQMTNRDAYELTADMTIDGEGGHQTYKNLNFNYSKNNKVTTSYENSYPLVVRNGQLVTGKNFPNNNGKGALGKGVIGDTDEDDARGYIAMIMQMACDADITYDEAEEMFESSNLYKTVLKAIESNTDSYNVSKNSKNQDGNNESGLNNSHWYDEEVKTIVVRRYVADTFKLGGDLVCEDKIDVQASNLATKGKSANENQDRGKDTKWKGAKGEIQLELKFTDKAPFIYNYPDKTIRTILNKQALEGARFIVPNQTTDSFTVY